ncbi:ATP-binding protein [Pseudorhodoferax sp. Leaf267]|uniref:ATP-binding protein n=1 Tax=Pseudorhodoferax sp. Leaf267 TaxID=1736316 RepID=UPI0006FB8C46|nr:ATP-binding protein [Pseudorhodoferax sp. Leaf267]KQP17804.1 histidine kinase [Pseudorhodoferax sp. Leaf267]
MPTPDPHAWPFLQGGGAMAALMAAFEWESTALGPMAQWPAHVCTATALMLRSQVPIVMLWGPPGVMVYNDAYAVFAGQRHPRLLGSNVREGWAEVADFNDNVMRTCLAGGTLHYRDQELTLVRHGRAEQVWMDLDYSPMLDDAGMPAGVMAVVLETTAKVHAERALVQERESLRRLFQQAPSFMAMLEGPEHRIVMANPNYLRLVDHRPVLGRTVAEALPDAVAQGYLALLDQVMRSGEPYHARGSRYAVQATPGGPVHDRYVDFVFQPIRDGSDAVSGVFVEGVDVTDRMLSVQRSEALIALTDALRPLDDSVDIGYIAARIVGETLGVSRVGYGGIVPEADTLHVVRDWVAPGVQTLAGVLQLREFGSFIDSLKDDRTIRIADVREDARTAPAAAALEQRHARSFVNVPVLEQGRLVALFYVNHADVRDWSPEEVAFIREVADRTRTATERVRAEAAVRESEARLREANESLEAKVQARTRELMDLEATLRQSQKTEAIGQLTGGIAHDFNNLLGSMGSSLQILERRLLIGKTENAARYIGMAQDAVRRAASLTQRLLAFSRRQTLDPKPMNVNRLVAGMEEMVRRSMGPAVQVEVVGAGGLWPTLVDGPQLENAVLNLCINARDAMAPDGGRLTIETANKWLDERAAMERDLPPGQYISVCVTDTGCGMAPEIVARIFDPFFTTKPMGQGTGLGLSMVYGFVRQSGGQVRAYSEVGRGTTMCLYLPRYMGEMGEDEAPGAVAAGAVEPERSDGEVVLVVEDEAIIRMLIAEMLEESGYRVLTAADGPAALQVLLSDARIDLLLSDVGLPGGLNGRQVADAARVQRPALKVLFITGYAENAAIGNGLLAPGMQVITKPFDIAALAAKVRDMVEQ